MSQTHFSSPWHFQNPISITIKFYIRIKIWNYFLLRQIKPGSIAEKVGLKVKDSLVKIGNDCALDYTIDEAMESLKKGKDFFDMIVER